MGAGQGQAESSYGSAGSAGAPVSRHAGASGEGGSGGEEVPMKPRTQTPRPGRGKRYGRPAYRLDCAKKRKKPTMKWVA